MAVKDLYHILGIEPGSDESEIKSAYRALARKYHPDVSDDPNDHSIFQEVVEAYNILSDNEERIAYDKTYQKRRPTEEMLRKYEEQQESAEENKTESKGFPGKSERQTSKVHEKVNVNNARADSFSRLNRAASVRLGGSKSSADSGLKRAMTGIMKKMSIPGFEEEEITEEEIAKEEIKTPPRQKQSNTSSTTAKPNKKANTRSIRGDRTYQFTIDAMEALSGSNRQLAVNQSDGIPRTIKVNIPGGVHDGATLRVKFEDYTNGETRPLKINIRVTPHRFVSLEGLDIIYRVPITVSEAIEGTEVMVPTPKGPIYVTIPPYHKIDHRVRARGRGLARKEDTGDVYIEPLIVTPDDINETVTQASKALESFYSTPVRKDFPKEF